MPTNITQAITMVKRGSSIKSAAKACSVPFTTLRKRICSLGFQTKGQMALQTNAIHKKTIRELAIAGMSYAQISRQTGVNEHTVRQFCSDIVSHKNKSFDGLTKKETAIQMRKNGAYIPEIAKHLQCSKGNVSLWLSNHEKQTGEDLHTRANLRKKKEDAVKCGSNKVNLKKAVAQRLKGWSVKEIAEKLSVSIHAVKTVLRQHVFSPDELAVINAKAVARIKKRRELGELKPVGGVREGSGRAKTGYHKGIYCGSTYELCWVVYALDHKIGFSRFPETLKHNGVTYVPDFLLDDGTTIIELKGYEREGAVAKKTAVAEHHGYTVKVLRKEDLTFAFEHIKNYGVTADNCYSLYDGYKPKYDLVCSQCNTKFERDYKPRENKDNVVFCGRKCSGKYRTIKNHAQGSCKGHTASLTGRGATKLTPEQIRGIFKDDRSYSKIAKDYGVHTSMVGHIKTGRVHGGITAQP